MLVILCNINKNDPRSFQFEIKLCTIKRDVTALTIDVFFQVWTKVVKKAVHLEFSLDLCL
jgi:hypothetical protein